MRELSSRVHRHRASARAGRVGSSASSAGDSARPPPDEQEDQIDTIFDTKDITSFLEEAESDGVIDETALESKALELELDDDELALLRQELESRGVDVTARGERPAATATTVSICASMPI